MITNVLIGGSACAAMAQKKSKKRHQNLSEGNQSDAKEKRLQDERLKYLDVARVLDGDEWRRENEDEANNPEKTFTGLNWIFFGDSEGQDCMGYGYYAMNFVLKRGKFNEATGTIVPDSERGYEVPKPGDEIVTPKDLEPEDYYLWVPLSEVLGRDRLYS